MRATCTVTGSVVDMGDCLDCYVTGEALGRGDGRGCAAGLARRLEYGGCASSESWRRHLGPSVTRGTRPDTTTWADQYRDGVTVTEIAAQEGVDKSTVALHLKRQGLILRRGRPPGPARGHAFSSDSIAAISAADIGRLP